MKWKLKEDELAKLYPIKIGRVHNKWLGQVLSAPFCEKNDSMGNLDKINAFSLVYFWQ